MANWPSIAEPKFPIKCRTIYPASRGKTDSPYVISKVQWSGARKIWELEWDDRVSLPKADFDTLLAFFLDYQALEFNWQHPGTLVTWVVQFECDEIEESMITPGYYALRVILGTTRPIRP